MAYSFKDIFREISSIIYRSTEKIKDKYFWSRGELEEAKRALSYLQKKMKKNSGDAFWGKNSKVGSIKPFKRGFNMKSVTFITTQGTEEKKWVLKIGHRISPVIDFGDPSTFRYYKRQKEYTEIIRKNLTIPLRYLLPTPQYIMWYPQTTHHVRGTTVIVEPFIHVIPFRKARFVLNNQERIILLNELIAFRLLLATLLKKHKLAPDLLGEGNLEIAKIGDEYHFVLLDLGLVDLHFPLPLTHTIMHFAKESTLSTLEQSLK